jgi:hypothetical protein
VTIHWCNRIDVRFVLAIRRRFRRELLTGDEAQRIAAIRQTAAAFARAAYVEDYIGVSLHLMRQLLRLVRSLVGPISLKPA